MFGWYILVGLGSMKLRYVNGRYRHFRSLVRQSGSGNKAESKHEVHTASRVRSTPSNLSPSFYLEWFTSPLSAAQTGGSSTVSEMPLQMFSMID